MVSTMAFQCLFLIITFMFCAFSTSFSEILKFEHPVKDDGSLSILVVGDWGRRGQYNQSKVASQMGRIGKKLNVAFVISTGDNFYDDGLKGITDPAFEESFTNIYTAKSLQKQWYSVLGNHDYRGDALAQLSPVLTSIDQRWICQRSFKVNTEIADFFFVDTTPFVENYFIELDHSYDWRGVLPRITYIGNILKDLETSLRDSSATWKIVVGHHPIRSVGHHGHTQELIKHMLPILNANNVDLYLNGHDHCLEHITSLDSPIQFFTSGGGSKAWRGDTKIQNNNDLKFYYDGQGFMSLQISPTNAEIAFHDVFGQSLHGWRASKQLYSSM